jgi:hypothetical protein
MSKDKSTVENKDTLSVSGYYRDIYPDTWVGTDALGRTMPVYQEAGPVKNDHRRVVGIFYITWHGDKNSDITNSYVADISRILKEDPEARLDDNNPNWKKDMFYHWGEPELGYFLSKDEYVIRKDMSMLSDAGVDVIILDVTNASLYWDEWDTIFAVMEKMKAGGNKVPEICFWAFNGPVYTVVQELYDKFYKVNKYKDLWFYWDDKPLLLYNNTGVNDAGKVVNNPNPHFDAAVKADSGNIHYGDSDYTEKYYKDYTKDVKKFFTKRTMWWGFYEWNGERFIGTEDNWSYGYQLNDERAKNMSSDDLISKHNGIKEEAAVTPAQHAPTNLSMVGKSWSRKNGEPALNQFDLPLPAYVPWLGKTVNNPEGYGIYFQERWDEALKADPPFIYLNDWNEWKAYFFSLPNGETTPFMRRKSPYFFVDQYNAEFNRDIQPMKGGYTDNYYMQMAENIRRYKGVRSIPLSKGFTEIKMNTDFSDWDKVKTEYRDTKGDTFHRNYNGYYNMHYIDTSGRNDIITCKAAVDKDNIYFYAETNDTLTPYTGNNWMLIFIDVDKDHNTGWNGYDFLINKKIINSNTTTLMRYDNDSHQWVYVSDLNYYCSGKKLAVAVPRKLINLNDKDSFAFDFHWCDNPSDLNDPVSLCTTGDSAPNRRFNYRFDWRK